MKKKYLTKAERSQFSLTQDLKDILAGLLLGDLCSQKRTEAGNPIFRFEQGIKNKEYIFHLYELFKSYCPSAPKITSRLPDKRTGEIYTRVCFYTYALPCLNSLHNLFYPEGKKVVPSNIEDLLTPKGLAYLIQDDGGFHKHSGSVVINTNSFQESDVDLLISILTNKFELGCRKDNSGNGFRIYVRKSSVLKLREIVTPHFHSSMLYKLGL